MAFSYRLLGFEPCLSALERPTRAVRSETVAVRSFTSSVKSVMGIIFIKTTGPDVESKIIV